jgi:sigma-B regulation protein RsbU (phosphoserine phosphatase)
MRILIAEDDPLSRQLLETSLQRWGYEVRVTCDGTEAYEVLGGVGPPPLAILDWMMPGLDGVEVCRKIRADQEGEGRGSPPYLILLTARVHQDDRVVGLEAGADDYVTKPFDHAELRARVQVGMRVASLQRNLAARVTELEQTLQRVHQLHGLLPICAYCKSIRNDENYWQQVEEYIMAHCDARFSHGICPACYDRIIGPELSKARGP